MKKITAVTTIVAITSIMAILAGCETTSSNTASINTSQKEMLLTQAGFKAKTVTTPKQQEQVAKLAVDVVSAVKYQGKLYYVFPTGPKNQILVGRQPQFDTYKKMLAAQQAKSSQAAAASQAQAQPYGQDNMYAPERTGETAGPNHIQVEVFDGFGPMWP